MKPLFTVFILSVIVLHWCQEKGGDAHQVLPVRVLSVTLPDTIQLGQPIRFETTCGTSTPCWLFKRFEISQTRKQYSITVYAEYDGRPCVQVIGTLKASSSVVPQERGTYTFRFWRARDRTLDRVVVVQ